MKALNFLSWENFTSTVFLYGQQRVHRVSDAPLIEIFGDGISNRVGLWLEIPQVMTVPPELFRLASVTCRKVRTNGRDLLEVATAKPSLYRQLYYFAIAVAERVVVDKESPLAAVTMELQSFSDLLEPLSLLSIERQLGLLGELLFLERLVTQLGLYTLNAWLGPLGEPHDFRLRDHEFEVKTTATAHRIHMINGMEQLVPSKSCLLFMISVLLGPPGAGAGFSLNEKATELSARFGSDPARLAQFNKAMESSGFRDEDRVHYSRPYILRRPLGIVAIDSSFPSITRLTLKNALGALAPRVETMHYDVNVEGLEHEDGTDKFDTTIAG